MAIKVFPTIRPKKLKFSHLIFSMGWMNAFQVILAWQFILPIPTKQKNFILVRAMLHAVGL